MDDPGVRDVLRALPALRVLEPGEIDAVERLVQRLLEDGWIHPAVADRWQVALHRARLQHPLRHAQG